ncbi:MAG: DinB family protein [Bacteroidota bacterium]
MKVKEEIIEGLEQAFDQLGSWLSEHPDAKFSQGPAGKWTTGQHIDHLIRSMQPLTMALNLPKPQIQMMFGEPNREGRTYEEVVEKYQAKLAAGGASSGQYDPKEIPAQEKHPLVEELMNQKTSLQETIAQWEEADLDAYLLPHPLMGKMLVREMLFFTVYHTRHHTRNLVENYA